MMKKFKPYIYEIISWMILTVSTINCGIYIGCVFVCGFEYPLHVHLMMIPNTLTMLIYSDIIPLKKKN